MSFDTPNGTRGSRQPSGPLFRWLNNWASRRLRRKGGKMMGFNALVLTTVGRKSGIERTNPVGWFPGTDSSWLIVASAAGAARNPGVVLQHRRASGPGPGGDRRPQGSRGCPATPRG